MADLATDQTARFSWRRATVLVVVIGYVIGTFSLAHASNYDQGLLLVGVVFAILALSLDLVAGTLGLYSLGHAGLFAISAYLTTILNVNYHWNLFLTLPFVIVINALLGLVIGALALRVSGLYFAITTYIFTLIVTVLLQNLTITGSYQGIPGPPFPHFPHSLDSLGTALVWACSGALAVTIVIIWSIRRSAAYPVLLSVRDAEPFAASAGVRTSRTRVLIFTLSAAIAGLAGWAFCFLGFLNPSDFSGTTSINILVMVILGGMNTLVGPIIGAAFISLFPVVVAWNPLWQEVLFGAIFVFVIVVIPEGLVGLFNRAVRTIRGRNSTATSELAEPTARVAGSGESVFEKVEESFASEYALEARNIDFSYVAGVPVLQNVDLTVRRGSIHGLIGPNGSGKSTLVNLLSGQLSPNAGSIFLNGHEVSHLHAADRPRYGLMRTFQSAVMVRDISTKDNVSIGLYSKYRWILVRSLIWPFLPSGHRDGRSIDASSAAALARVGMGSDWARAKVADVPHGVEQLTQLAAAYVGTPSVLILDEPLAGLSTGEVDTIGEILRDLSRSGVTVIIVEHQTRFIFSVCDEITVIAAGELVKAGSAADVRSDHRVREVYLGQ
jgi:branched-chain amino acid transport system permease protein